MIDDGDYPCWACGAESVDRECEACGLPLCDRCLKWVYGGRYCEQCASDVVMEATIDPDQKETY